MSDIFREVDEAMQQEKFERIWHEYKSTIIASILILIAGTAIMTTYKSWNANRNAEETGRLIEAVNAPNSNEKINALIKDTRKGHKAIGYIVLANNHVEKGEYADAVSYYDKTVESSSTPNDIKNLARILSVQNNPQLPTEIQKTADAQLKLLNPILKNKKSPWIWHATIEAALIEAEQKNNYAQAIKYLEPFKETNYIPLSLKTRAEALAHVYTLKNNSNANDAGEK